MLVSNFAFGLFVFEACKTQAQPRWDNPASQWPSGVVEVSIMGQDKTSQRAMFYHPSSDEARPLIVSLHTWSGDYLQKDTLSWMSINRGYYYIHPDFRGPNNNPDACGSPLVINDIDGAIDYALENGNIDSNNIHIIGVSGGGHSALLAYMKSRHVIKSFTAFVPISNLVDWYYESLGRGNKYAKDIALATSGKPDSLNIDEAQKRSPFFMEMPQNRKESQLSLYCGVHDGYIGSVPITQSVHFYNKIISDMDSSNTRAIIPQTDIETLLRQRNYGLKTNENTLLGREVIYSRSFKDKVKVAVFEGGHEMPKGDVLGLIEISQ